MTELSTARIAERLLAHMHLTAAQASVMVVERKPVARLVVYIFDKQASARVRSPAIWCGHPVEVVRNAQISLH